MPKTPQTAAIIGAILFTLMIGAHSLPQIVSFFAPPPSGIEQGPLPQDQHIGNVPLKKGNPYASETYSLAKPLPRGTAPAVNTNSALSAAPTNVLQMEEQDPTLDEEEVPLSLEEQYAREQYLQETEAQEEMLQRDFDPTVAQQHLTAEQAAAAEEEIQEEILQEEAPSPLLQDIQPDER